MPAMIGTQQSIIEHFTCAKALLKVFYVKCGDHYMWYIPYSQYLLSRPMKELLL